MFNYLFQAIDEKIIDEVNPTGMANIKVESGEFCDANYDGMSWLLFVIIYLLSYGYYIVHVLI